MRNMEDENDSRTVFCGNLSEEVTDAILFELFNQAGPVEVVRRPIDHNGHPKSFGFVVYKHESSVPYALELLRGTKLFNRTINMNSRSKFDHVPVLDTHITEFTLQRDSQQNVPHSLQQTYMEHLTNDYNNYYRDRRYRNEDRHRNESSHSRHHHSSKKRDSNEPSSWAEYNALRGKGSLSNGQYRVGSLQDPALMKREPISNSGLALPLPPDFDALLQMGQQVTFSGMGNIGMMPMGLGPSLGGSSMYPSMQGRLSGGEHNSPNRDRGRTHENRESRRDHPYSDRWHNERRDEHRRHDRGYSSSHSSHERERRDRKSR